MYRFLTIITVVVLAGVTSANAQQRYYTKSGHIHFYSEAPLETIEANNDNVVAILETLDGKLQFAVLMKSFQFEKALMQEHFNENYVESDKHPKSVFRGSIVDYDDKKLRTDGTHDVVAEGELTIHGVTHSIKVPGQFIVDGETIRIKTTFMVKPADYDISIPSVVRDNIAKEIDVTVDVKLEPYEK